MHKTQHRERSSSQFTTLCVLFVLYIAQGIPIGIFSIGFVTWLTSLGAPSQQVAAVAAAATFPWTFKFVFAPIIDRFTFLPMGRRRTWIVSSQFLMVLGLLTLGLLDPNINDLTLIAWATFIIITLSAIQDVAVDGMAVDLLNKQNLAKANGLMFGGQSLGIAMSSVLVGKSINSIGIKGTLVFAALIVSVVLLISLLFQEHKGQKLLPWTSGSASGTAKQQQVKAWSVFANTITREMLAAYSVLLVLVMFTQGVMTGLTYLLLPYVSDECFWIFKHLNTHRWRV